MSMSSLIAAAAKAKATDIIFHINDAGMITADLRILHPKTSAESVVPCVMPHGSAETLQSEIDTCASAKKVAPHYLPPGVETIRVMPRLALAAPPRTHVTRHERTGAVLAGTHSLRVKPDFSEITMRLIYKGVIAVE